MPNFKALLHRDRTTQGIDDQASVGSSQGKEKDAQGHHGYVLSSNEEQTTAVDPTLKPGELSFDEGVYTRSLSLRIGSLCCP